jgi:acyl-CoA thioester hydrolase
VDTDSSGFAHFSSYVRMMEETEYEFLREHGLSVVLRDENGVMGFPRIHVSLSIIHPLRFEQDVVVDLSLIECDGKQMTFDFAILNDQEQTCVNGQFVVACCRFPDDGPPFAILIPDYVEQSLTSRNS